MTTGMAKPMLSTATAVAVPRATAFAFGPFFYGSLFRRGWVLMSIRRALALVYNSTGVPYRAVLTVLISVVLCSVPEFVTELCLCIITTAPVQRVRRNRHERNRARHWH